MAHGWTPERRARQAKLIRNWKPWERATGPKTEAGKARISRNAYLGGIRKLLRELARQLRLQREELDDNAEWLLTSRPNWRGGRGGGD